MRRFAEAYAIEYPMLSDVGSKVIRAFGILNTNVPEDHQMMYGIPWPGDYLVGPDGIVRDKLFLRNYEYRASASQALLRNFTTPANCNRVEISTEVLFAAVTLSADRCFPGQELGIGLEVLIKPGWHIYGEPISENYQPAQLTFEGPLIAEQSLGMPPAKSLMLQALGETLPVYEGNIHATGSLRIKWSPPIPASFLEPLGRPIEPGLHHLDATFRFQACSDQLCEPPRILRFRLPLKIEAGIPAASQKTAE